MTEPLTPAAALLLEATCCCQQTHGRHAMDCPVTRISHHRDRRRRFLAAITRHDTRLLAPAPPVCASCGQTVDPDNLCRLNGIAYHLGNCPRPHGWTPPSEPLAPESPYPPENLHP